MLFSTQDLSPLRTGFTRVRRFQIRKRRPRSSSVRADASNLSLSLLPSEMLETVLFASVRFHDTTSRGRLLNRFGKDLEFVPLRFLCFFPSFLFARADLRLFFVLTEVSIHPWPITSERLSSMVSTSRSPSSVSRVSLESSLRPVSFWILLATC